MVHQRARYRRDMIFDNLTQQKSKKAKRESPLRGALLTSWAHFRGIKVDSYLIPKIAAKVVKKRRKLFSLLWADEHLLKTVPVPSLTETMQWEVVGGQVVTLPTSSGLAHPTNWSHSWQLSGGGGVVVVVVVVVHGRCPESTFVLSLRPPSEVFRTHLFWSALHIK